MALAWVRVLQQQPKRITWTPCCYRLDAMAPHLGGKRAHAWRHALLVMPPPLGLTAAQVPLGLFGVLLGVHACLMWCLPSCA